MTARFNKLVEFASSHRATLVDDIKAEFVDFVYKRAYESAEKNYFKVHIRNDVCRLGELFDKLSIPEFNDLVKSLGQLLVTEGFHVVYTTCSHTYQHDCSEQCDRISGMNVEWKS